MKILLKILAGIAIGFLVIGFCIIPLILYFVIPSQGAKILKTPVHIESVFFNPITLDLRMNGLSVNDNQNQTLLGFKSLRVDVSAIDLIKGKYHVEKVLLDGLTVTTVLQADGHINLLDLADRAMTSAETQPKAVKETPPAKPETPTTIPLVVVDHIILSNGKVSFSDQSITPNFATKMHDMNLSIDGFSTDPSVDARVAFNAKLDEKGVISNEALLKPLSNPLSLETTFNLNAYALTILSPYVGKYTGHALSDGSFDLSMTYRISDHQLTASHKILVQHFKFGQKVDSKDALHLPFSLAVALLEDPQGRIKITLPVKGDMSDPKFEYWHLVGQVVTNFFTKIVTKPFTFLASMISGSEDSTDELGSVRFVPGQFDLALAEQAKLKTLVKGLTERPKLKLAINGSYDPDLDWRAIKTQMFDQEYKTLRADSKKSEAVVYHQLFQRRFGIKALWALAKKYKQAVGKYDDDNFIIAMKKQLIENAPADKGALDVLAKARAQVVFNALVAAGFPENRLDLGATQQTVGSMGQVPLEFALTVIE